MARGRVHSTSGDGRKRPPHRVVFRLGALLIVPGFLLLAAEFGLRLAGFGYPTAFFLRQTRAGQPVFIDNQEFGKRFFPRGLTRYPHPLTMPSTKQPGDLRVFVLGESAAMGDPDPKFGLPRMLEILLQDRFPGRQVQVVNAAMVAINSHVIVPIARECARRDGDLWVIYMGNNEMIGPFGAITPFSSPVPARPLIQASLALKQTRLGQSTDWAWTLLPRGRSAPTEWGGMTMWGQQQVRQDDPRTGRVHEHFRRNLAEILSIGRAAGVPIILCTVATNLKDCAPFGSLHSPTLATDQKAAWDAAWQRGKAAEDQGDFTQAQLHYQRAQALDPGFAELSFRLARCSARLGAWKEAATLFAQARDQDTLQFRADSTINQIVRHAAAAWTNGVHLLEADRLLAEQSPHGIPGEEFFYEHVHLTPEGNDAVARAAAELAASILSRPAANSGAARTDQDARAWTAPEECLRKLGFTEWNRHDLISRILTERVEQPPFTGQANHEQHAAALRARLAQSRSATKPAQVARAARQVAEAVAHRPADADLRWNLAQLWDLANDPAKSEEQWRSVIRLWPHAPLPYLNLGKLLESHGRGAEARALYQKCLELKPDDKEARLALGQAQPPRR